MRKQYLIQLFLLCFMMGFFLSTTAQNIKKDNTKSAAAKMQSAVNVSIFQVHFTEIDETLERFLTKNRQILHFRGEPNSNTYIIYLEDGNTKGNLSDLLKSNDINKFDIIRFQQGARKANLFNKRL